MSRIIVEIDNPSNIKRFINILEDLKYVKYYTPEKDNALNITPLTDDDWVKPGRLATDEEFEAMIKECEEEYESGKTLTSEQVKSITLEKIAAWQKENSM